MNTFIRNFLLAGTTLLALGYLGTISTSPGTLIYGISGMLLVLGAMCIMCTFMAFV